MTNSTTIRMTKIDFPKNLLLCHRVLSEGSKARERQRIFKQSPLLTLVLMFNMARELLEEGKPRVFLELRDLSLRSNVHALEKLL